MNTFANLWPDELSTEEPLRDLGYAPSVGLPDVVAKVIASHHHRNVLTAQAFKDIAADGRGSLGRDDIEGYVRQFLVRGREDYAHTGQEGVHEFVSKLMDELDTNGDGRVSWLTFSEWNRRNSLEKELWKQVHAAEKALREEKRRATQTLQERIDALEAQVRSMGKAPVGTASKVTLRRHDDDQ